MKLRRGDVPKIYALTTEGEPADVRQQVDQFVAAGARWIQLRVKKLDDRDLSNIATGIVASLPAQVKLFVNDRVDIALLADSDGVHLGDHDLPPDAARIVAADREILIGFSTHSADDAIAAAAGDSIDYVAIGPIYRSPSKDVREPLGLDVLRRIRAATAKPIVAIGGIDERNVGDVIAAGADSAAVISALHAGTDSIVRNFEKLLRAAEASV